MIGSHLTDACKHAEKEWCIHCEEGCRACGVLEELTENSICEGCEHSRSEFLADMIYESQKCGESA